MAKITESTHLDRCLITGEFVTKVLDLGQHAYADTFIAEDQVHMSEPVFPLQLHLNPNSGQIQLGYVSDAEDRYNLYSYSYTSSNSKTARDHWDEYADTIKNKYNTKGLVVEIGSNDAYLIKQFQDKDTTVLGIDSSQTMCDIAKEKGVESLAALFNTDTAVEVAEEYGKASVIIANNVFNHANDPVNFASGVAQLLDDGGIFVFELPYWASMIDSGRFVDMVYHEHISYFTIKSAWNLLQQVGLDIVDFDVVDYHGGSIRVIAKHSSGNGMPFLVRGAIENETSMGLFDTKFYEQLQEKFIKQRNDWLLNFYQILANEPDAVIIGVGAAAKANTWLTWHKLDKTVLNCITDASQFKQGKYTPLSRIPIRSDDEFARHEKPYALVLSWNIGEPLKKALLNINPNTRFISQ
jgi:SAM-dependent methyltransferase